MSDVVFYRKYRPTNFSEVLGQEHITEVLKSAINNDQVSHAYLFSGPRGTGKTSVARILASELKVSGNDLYEIDGASNRGIDEIRELREAVKTLPFDSNFKVYVIDEVHMLTRDAFNALLKTLEEPPLHVIFILATTELHKVPDTIISRCQSFAFKKPTTKTLIGALSGIAKKEKANISDDALSLISFLGEGSFRDAEGTLEQVMTIAGKKKIDRELVEQIAGAPSLSLVKDFISSAISGNVKEGLSAVHTSSSQNNDMKIFLGLVMILIIFKINIS